MPAAVTPPHASKAPGGISELDYNGDLGDLGFGLPLHRHSLGERNAPDQNGAACLQGLGGRASALG